MDFQEKMLNKMLQKTLGELPDMSQLMGGFDLKDGVLKATVEYKLSDGGELDIENGCVILCADKEYTASAFSITSTLTLKIRPLTIGFVFIPLTYIHPINQFNILFGGKEDTISFSCHSSVTSRNVREVIKKGTPIGYGFFIPITPINSINFLNTNAKTP